MAQSHDQSRLARRPSTPPVTSRPISTQDLETVIRRAVELQTDSSPHLEEGLSEARVVRIGEELGLDPANVRRAMAEVARREAVETGVLVALVGPRSAKASRIVNRPAADVAAELERYLRERELMLTKRRFPDRTRFIRDSSLGAGLRRLARGLSRSPHQPLSVKQLDVSVSAIDGETCLVELGIDLAGTRGGLAGGLIGSTGGAAAIWGGLAWATALPDALALLGLPLLGGAWIGARAIFGAVRRSALEKCESLLDRVEHNMLF